MKRFKQLSSAQKIVAIFVYIVWLFVAIILYKYFSWPSVNLCPSDKYNEYTLFHELDDSRWCRSKQQTSIIENGIGKPTTLQIRYKDILLNAPYLIRKLDTNVVETRYERLEGDILDGDNRVTIYAWIEPIE